MLAELPIPRDIPLDLPLDRLLLQGLIIILFLLHILFVNIMLGTSILAVVFEIMGLRRPDFDTLAHKVASTITVNKSMAVVLGVGPLLAINVMYTMHFYSANALTGNGWIMIVPLVALAFLIGYAYKYSWQALSRAKGLHIALGSMAALLFLVIPFIFLANINLMLFPERWDQVNGFLSSLALPNVLPRYLHFILASFAVSGLFLLIYMGRKAFPVESAFTELTRPQLKRMFYGIIFGATAAQAIAGPLVFFTLPANGVDWIVVLIFAVAIGFAIAFMVQLWREITSEDALIGSRHISIVALMTLTVCFMAFGRHMYRETCLRDHNAQIAARTSAMNVASNAAAWRLANGIVLDTGVPLGERVFRDTCSACHALDRTVVGPPLTEIADIYKDNPAGIVVWTNNPGRKRTDLTRMPPFRLGYEKLTAVANYMLELAKPEK